MGTRLRYNLFEILKKHKVLNTMEACRLLNECGKDNYLFCHEGLKFGENRTAQEHNDGWCNYLKNGCNPRYKEVHRNLERLQELHYVYSRKMRFWDKGKALPTDIFRLWYIHLQDFQELVLKQTLIPYVQGVGEAQKP